jgi:hypothetical protein
LKRKLNGEELEGFSKSWKQTGDEAEMEGSFQNMTAEKEKKEGICEAFVNLAREHGIEEVEMGNCKP